MDSKGSSSRSSENTNEPVKPSPTKIAKQQRKATIPKKEEIKLLGLLFDLNLLFLLYRCFPLLFCNLGRRVLAGHGRRAFGIHNLQSGNDKFAVAWCGMGRTDVNY
nr:hypothetical protein [Tanacetum cinerariifolium]